MVNQDNTKIGIFIVAVAGTIVVGYVLYKQWKKKRDEEMYELTSFAWQDVRRRTGSRGRTTRSGRLLSDPGRIIPLPSEIAKEGIYKRQSAGARLSQMPSIARCARTMCVVKSQEVLTTEYARNDSASAVSTGGVHRAEGTNDMQGERAGETQVEKSRTDAAQGTSSSKASLSVGTSPVPSQSLSSSEGTSTVTSKQASPSAATSKHASPSTATSKHASPARYTEGSGDGGAGEAMANPDESRGEDQLGVSIGDIIGGDSEGSDLGAGDSLAEDTTVIHRAGLNLSPASSLGSSPAKSPRFLESDVLDSASGGELKLDSEAVIRTILQVQKSPNTVDKKVVKVLVDLLEVKEEKLLLTALESVTRCAAFSSNQKALCENKAPEQLSRLLQVQSEAHLGGTASTDNILVSINNAIMNLSMDMANQAKLESCVPILVDLVLHEGTSSSVKLSSLQPLTNLSMTHTYHDQYVRAVPRLYSLLDSANRVLRIQALKVLVNLSCNSVLVAHLLTAKAPKCLMSILDWTADPFLTLRLITLLANLASTVQKENITAESLPFEENLAITETVYMAIFDADKLSLLRSKIQTFTRHDSEDIAQQASRLYTSLPKC